MRIAYCTNVRFPSERAHGHQIAQVCDALTTLGHQVTVFAPYRKSSVKQEMQSYYGTKSKINLRHLGHFDPIESPLFPGVMGLWKLNHQLRKELRSAIDKNNFDLLYTRSPALLPALLSIGIPVILELHQLPRFGRRSFVKRCNQCKLVACLTSSMRQTLIGWGVDEKKVMVEGDAVDVRRFEKMPSIEEARKGLNIPEGRLVVGYVGRLKTLGMEKGVGILLDAIAKLSASRKFFALIVGGPKSDRDFYEAKARSLGLTASDVLFTGEVPAGEVPKMLAACDVLAMPFPDLPHYRHHMSPLKMFEYMAAKRPIVTTDLPTIREVLSAETAFFCKPGDARSLEETLQWIAQYPDDAQKRAEKAYELVQNHTWERRMERILETAKDRLK